MDATTNPKPVKWHALREHRYSARIGKALVLLSWNGTDSDRDGEGKTYYCDRWGYEAIDPRTGAQLDWGGETLFGGGNESEAKARAEAWARCQRWGA